MFFSKIYKHNVVKLFFMHIMQLNYFLCGLIKQKHSHISQPKTIINEKFINPHSTIFYYDVLYNSARPY